MTPPKTESNRPVVLTVGHSTHAAADFDRLLARHAVRLLVDVRTIPRSRRVPHAAGDALAERLPRAGVDYLHLPGLGGLRKPRADSPNSGWESSAFRGYADHMRSAEFCGGLEALEGLARERSTAVMCAEALWWRCHRRLIADALVVRGWTVLHITPDGAVAEHELTPFAVVADGHLTYPSSQGRLEV